ITTNTSADGLGNCSTTVIVGTATATDNSDSNPAITATRSDGKPLTDPYPKGTTTITWRATDACGNFSECMQTVTVNDNEPPSITCPDNIVTNTAPGACSQVVNFTPTTSDNCTNVTVVCNPPSGSTFFKGVTTVGCGVTDGSGNTNGCTFTVTVNDNE